VVAPVLAVALAFTRRPTAAQSGGPGPDRPHVRGGPIGRQRADPRRAARAGDRREHPLRPALPVASARTTAEPDLAHLLARSRARHLGGRPVRGADPHLQGALRPGGHRPWPARAGAPGGDGAPDRRLGVAPAGGGDGLGPAAPAPHPGSGPHLRRRLPRPGEGAGPRDDPLPGASATGERRRRTGDRPPAGASVSTTSSPWTSATCARSWSSASTPTTRSARIGPCASRRPGPPLARPRVRWSRGRWSRGRCSGGCTTHTRAPRESG
jgi:hypothetical protein